MLIATYYTPDKNILIRNKKDQIIIKRRYAKRGNIFTIPYQKIKTKNRLKLIKKTKPNFELLNILFKYLPPERNYKTGRVKINKSLTESTKACIYPALRQVYIHPDFLEEMNNIVERKLVMFHEVGHLFYATEAKADLFAATILYILGYSPRDIARASKSTLSNSPRNVDRWNILLKYFKNTKR